MDSSQTFSRLEAGKMMRYRTLALGAALVASLSTLALGGGCNTDPPINRVDVNVVEKSIFTGSWYMGRMVIDVDYEAAGIGTFPGDNASDFVGSFTSLPRIRWVIDQNYIYAYRDYEIVLGGDGEERTNDYLGQPIAAFKVQGHFDIKRDYNATTGEETNVLVENSDDRRWYQRQFMRVDWSKNVLPGYYGMTHDLYEVFGLYTREPADLYVQRESDFPDSWRPHFDYMQCNGPTDASCSEIERDYAGDYDRGELYHMSFVNQELLSPGVITDPFTGGPVNFCLSPYSDAPRCTSVAVYVRTSFLKVSPRHQYEATNWNETRFDRHGYFRLEGDTYDRATTASDRDFGFTDYLNYNVNRYNIWQQWHDAAGAPIPYASRQVKPVVWYTTPELPAHLVKPAYDLVGQWNVVMMSTIRRLQGRPEATFPVMDCQTDDPDGYCFCQADDSGETLNPTCPGHYNPFESPAAATARGVSNPYDCYVDVPAGAEPDMTNLAASARLRDEDFYGWLAGKDRATAPGARMVGAECAVPLRQNVCTRRAIAENGGTNAGLECEERGDLRYKFLSYVDQPGTAFLGIATMRGDPITGETIAGDANIGGPALDSVRTTALQTYDLVNGTITDRQFFTGEDVRGYLESLNQIDIPAPPRIDFNVALANGMSATDPAISDMTHGIQNQMDRFVERAENLRGPAGRSNIYSDRLRNLAGTPTERRLTDNPESLVLAGLGRLPSDRSPDDVTDAILDRVSPFRNDVHATLARQEDFDTRAGRFGYHGVNEYVDNSVTQWALKHASWPRARVEFELNRLIYRQTEIHEMGHCLGLRHDFGGSADTGNFHDDWYRINSLYPVPDPSTFNTDGTPGLSVAEQDMYDRAYRQTRDRRELAGIDGWGLSSIMDYSANWYQRLQPLGRYDQAAIGFGYGDLVDVADNEAGETPSGDARSPLAPDAINPVNTPRIKLKFYAGGESCETDADCPYSTSGANASDLLPANMTVGVTQHCAPSVHGATLVNVCSNFDVDMRAAAAGATPDYVPVRYRFCTDERATGGSSQPGTLGWCNRFDEGDSYREIVRNIQESYDRAYLFLNFRRYRSTFPGGSYFDGLINRRFVILQNIYQNLIAQYTADPAFRTQTGPFGFYDAFLGAADVFNFYARVMASPDIGAYTWNARWRRYERSNRDADAPGANLRVPLGVGKYFSSVYQAGLSGIFRLERIGTFYDKLFTMQLITQRGAVTSYTRDVPFFTNYYDLFPNEVQQLFGGMIRDTPEEYMPRVSCSGGTGGAAAPTCRDPVIHYMDFYRGDCSTASSTTCRPDPVDVTYRDLHVMNAGGNFTLQSYAAIYGLAEFPVFFDTSFQNQLFVCVEGQADCHAPNATDVDGVDYIRFTSSRFSKSYLAWQVESREGVAEQTSIGFAMLKEARDDDRIYQLLVKVRDGAIPYSISNLSAAEQAELVAMGYTVSSSPPEIDTEISRLYGRVADLESFFAYLIQLERDYGIAVAL